MDATVIVWVVAELPEKEFSIYNNNSNLVYECFAFCPLLARVPTLNNLTNFYLSYWFGDFALLVHENGCYMIIIFYTTSIVSTLFASFPVTFLHNSSMFIRCKALALTVSHDPCRFVDVDHRHAADVVDPAVDSETKNLSRV